MKKKKLLSEAQVKRFMGLAGIKPINEMYHMKKDDEMREMRGEMKKDDEMREQEEEMEQPMEEPVEEPEMEDEAEEADVEMDEEDLADVKKALDTLQDKLSPLLDQAEAEEEMDMEEEPAEEPEMEEEPAEEPEMEDEEEMDKELQEIDMQLSETEIVNEVARRVARRIVEAKRAHKKMNEALGRKK
jgi:hypothetical protein